KNFSRPLASTTFFRGQILPKLSVLVEFIEHLPAATELGVSFLEKIFVLHQVIGKYFLCRVLCPESS
ncbi:MAG: hypothetical protein V3U87_09215, partial [Methylococcaceae bacterium]